MRIVAFLLAVQTLCAADENTFVSTNSGISVMKPANWVFLAKHDQTAGNIAQLGRYPEPYPEMNATCRVRVLTAKETKGQSPRELAQTHVVQMTKNFSDYKVLDGPKDITCAGKKGTAFAAYFTVSHEGKPSRAFFKMIFIPHGSGSLNVTMACPQEQAEKFAADYESILESIQVR